MEKSLLNSNDFLTASFNSVVNIPSSVSTSTIGLYYSVIDHSRMSAQKTNSVLRNLIGSQFNSKIPDHFSLLIDNTPSPSIRRASVARVIATKTFLVLFLISSSRCSESMCSAFSASKSKRSPCACIERTHTHMTTILGIFSINNFMSQFIRKPFH